MRKLSDFIHEVVAPKSRDEDRARKEFILNILLFAAIILVSIASVINIFGFFFADPELYANNALSLVVVIGILAFFCLLFFLSRRGFPKISAYLFLVTFFLLASYLEYKHGVDVNAGLLINVLVIVISGILISTRFAFLIMAIIGITILVIDYLQRVNIFSANQYWREQRWNFSDTLMVLIIFTIIATVCWLSNREIYKALKRAKSSEAELKYERDSLEVKVEERTQELKRTQMEKVGQLYRFSEFGRLSSGLFHDLTNLLSAVSLNMEMAQNNQLRELDQTKSYLERAISANGRMKNFIEAIRRQISGQGSDTLFSLNEEIKQVIQILSYRSRKFNVEIEFTAPMEISTFGSAVKFNQIVTNLIANAIDAYADIDPDNIFLPKVYVFLLVESGMVTLTVEDRGCGIPQELLNKIFEPFFTTKDPSIGTGIGLSLTKRMVEQDFGGAINVESHNQHTKFIIKFTQKG